MSRCNSFCCPAADDLALSDDVSVLVTVIWLVAMMNAINLVDGLDGLAAGIVAIAAASFFVYTFNLEGRQFHRSSVVRPSGRHHHRRRHARLPATQLLSGQDLHGGFGEHAARPRAWGRDRRGDRRRESAYRQSRQTPTSQVFLAYFPLLIPLAVIAIPLADALLAIIRRARDAASVFHADKEHLHHRLMDLGHGHRQAVIVMYVWSALAAGAGLAFSSSIARK